MWWCFTSRRAVPPCVNVAGSSQDGLIAKAIMQRRDLLDPPPSPVGKSP